MLKLTESDVKSRLARSRIRLRRELEMEGTHVLAR